MTGSRYLIALGSNQRHVRFGKPKSIIARAISALARSGLHILDHSDTITSRPLGPSLRSYANAVILIETSLRPIALLRLLKSIESDFGVRRGQRWSRRVLDLDIILWNEGPYFSLNPALVIPHPHLRERGFVLGPAAQIAASWRDPASGRTIGQIWSRFSRYGNRVKNDSRFPSKPLDPRPKRH